MLEEPVRVGGVARGFMRNERFADDIMVASREGDTR